MKTTIDWSDPELQRRQAYIPELDISLIVPNPYQPRIEIKPESLIELSDSIRSNGIIEPLIVTKKSDARYELIAGERRWRAAQLAKMPTVPVIVKEASPLQMLELAIIENIHRKDLNALEEALAFEQLMNLFNMDHTDIAKKIGYSRPVITNKIRLLTLPDPVKKYLLEDQISEGHARALLGLSSREAMIAAAKIVIRDRLSVRQVEELVRRLNEGSDKKYKTKKNDILDDHTQTLEVSLQEKFGTSVKLTRSNRGGRIVIPFKDDQELKRIYDAII
ncbi:MAG TPA: ParB/RepB/Spo0J family partition protein [Candidatus Dojkabacteria bacterium]|jgi:ParB family chromosome partitioning protein|nr:ParB/RepB/Spo0J family partition protein [Candidatus Dojkabacteria bacterium]